MNIIFHFVVEDPCKAGECEKICMVELQFDGGICNELGYCDCFSTEPPNLATLENNEQ